jgi:hypothetical protein
MATRASAAQKGGDAMKVFSVSAFFPHAVAHKAYQSATVTASSFETAAARGLREIWKRDGIKGRRIRVLRLDLALLRNGSMPGEEKKP